MLLQLSSLFNKPNTTRKMRIGIIDFYATLFTTLGASFVETNYALIVRHLISELVQTPRSSTSRYEKLLSRKLIEYLLRGLIGARMLREQGQIGAIQELSHSYLKKWPALIPGQTAPSPRRAIPYGLALELSDTAPLTRTASYPINVLTTLIIYYDPASLSDPFWAQLLINYSALISTIIPVAESNLTRIHAVIATGLVGSPLNFYLFFYAVRSMWGGGERMKKILGEHNLRTRILVILAWAIWIALVIYILVPDTQHFSQ
ncbi:hypothetical protein M422DRAFT_245138 [Sphaerobolus stellatus SS14]|nr:hypothetical protein M422DRAFT_245138 [Sphaerobolus stellatus SS14]